MLVVESVPAEPPASAGLWGVAVRIIAALVLVLVATGCGPTVPSAAPGQVLHVINDSNRAVMVATGSLLVAHATTAARPCGGEVAVIIDPSSYEDDGRLMSFIVVDPNGVFDVALKGYSGDPIDMPGNFSGDQIWSDGTLAGRLPLYLTVAADLTVTESASPAPRSTTTCVPAY